MMTPDRTVSASAPRKGRKRDVNLRRIVRRLWEGARLEVAPYGSAGWMTQLGHKPEILLPSIMRVLLKRELIREVNGKSYGPENYDDFKTLRRYVLTSEPDWGKAA
jgi:hypothetical protein